MFDAFVSDVATGTSTAGALNIGSGTMNNVGHLVGKFCYACGANFMLLMFV